jgi:two-component system sensor histidine kinase KdpD
MSGDRPNPDDLLARVNAEEAEQSRGKLKIFFGAAPGVGKTYAMLEAGRKVAKEGIDVLVGYVEPHVRPETQALVLGLDMLARREIDYRGTKLLDFDVEAALARRPELILVDELAHTNAQGLTHAKRWQDVKRLLDAGIDVFTTLNVQHLESLNDVVAQITGIIVRETVPDSMFEQADEVELVDIAPDDLIERLHEGKVYLPQQAERAIANYFQKGNLIALRELALRTMAERVDAQMLRYRQDHAVTRTWPAADRLLVCIGPSPMSPRLVRATVRMATSLRAPWVALHVETAEDSRMGAEDSDRLATTLHLAEQLGGETATVTGEKIADAVLDYARSRNVTRIIVGKPQQPRWRELLRGSYVYELTRKCGDIDVYVISGDSGPQTASLLSARPGEDSKLQYLGALTVVGLCTGIDFALLPHFELTNLIMVYLLGVVAVAARFGHGPAVLASVASVAAFDFFFVPPHLTFAVSDVQYVFTFGVMLATALTISTLTARVRAQADAARRRERRTAALYALSRELLEVQSLDVLVELGAKHVRDLFGSELILMLAEFENRAILRKEPVLARLSTAAFDEREWGVAQWVFEHGQRAGRGTDTLPAAKTLFLPLKTVRSVIGVAGVQPPQGPRSLLLPEQVQLLETIAGQIAMAAERIMLAEEAHRAEVEVETERLRHSLFSAISHDLRTPLASIMGASSTLADHQIQLDEATRQELLQSILGEAERLNRLVTNLLEMTRLEAGALKVHKEPQGLVEVIGPVLQRLSRQLTSREVRVDLPADLPLVPLDDLLIQQVLTNLVENAAKYTPADSPIEIAASIHNDAVVISVADRGPGLKQEDRERVFEKFFRSTTNGIRSGVGLGLAICRGIVELHGGRIWAENRPQGGAIFRFTLPVGDHLLAEQTISAAIENVA